MSRSIYFPRIAQNFYPGFSAQESAYATWLKSTGASNNYLDLICLARGGVFPIKRGKQLLFEALEPEKTLAHLFGLYYEELLFEYAESLVENAYRNLKMRIVAPILYLKGSVFREDGEESVAAVSCGFDSEQNVPIVVNPYNGEYLDIFPQDYACLQGHYKLLMLNVPGMSRITQLDCDAIAIHAIKIYLRRFFDTEQSLYADSLGLKTFQQEMEHLQEHPAFPMHLQQQLRWLENLKPYVPLLAEPERQRLAQCMEIYSAARGQCHGA